MSNHKFFVIKLVNRLNGKSGFFISSKDKKITMSVGGVSKDVMQFAEYATALKYITKNKLKTTLTRAIVKSSDDLLKTGELKLQPNVLYSAEKDGKRLFGRGEGYYWDDLKPGYAVWQNRADLELLIKLSRWTRVEIIEIIPVNESIES